MFSIGIALAASNNVAINLSGALAAAAAVVALLDQF